MVDIKTLRIGSHVDMCGKRQRIAAIDALNGCVGIDMYKLGEDGTKYPIGYNVENIVPIAITPELLAELGFALINETALPEYTYWKKIHDGYPLELTYWGEDFNLQDKDWTIHIDNHDCQTLGGADVTFLHELETLVYLTTGEELIED